MVFDDGHSGGIAAVIVRAVVGNVGSIGNLRGVGSLGGLGNIGDLRHIRRHILNRAGFRLVAMRAGTAFLTILFCGCRTGLYKLTPIMNAVTITVIFQIR